MDRCRVCLDVPESKLYTLHGDIVNCDVSIGEMITYCTSIEVFQNDGFPNFVCIPCFRTIRIAYNFIRQFRETYEGTIQNDQEMQEVSSPGEEELNHDDQENGEHQIEVLETDVIKEELVTCEDGQVLVVENGSSEDDLFQEQDLVHTLEGFECDSLKTEDFDPGQEDIESHGTETMILPEQDWKGCQIEYELISDEQENSMRSTELPEQKVTKSIKKESSRDDTQYIRLRRKARTLLSCPVCPKLFFSSYDNEFIPHLSNHENETFPCNVCNSESMYTYKSFLLHFHKTHRFQCPYCGKSCARPQTLSTHIRIHSEHIYKCTYEGCNKTFPAAWNLRKHLTVHSEKTSYVCPECGKDFKTYDTYRYHLKKHSGRKFLCTHCGLAFMQSVHLKYHMWKHTGIKNFKCDLCVKSYTCVSQLKKHRKRHHPKAKEFVKYKEINEGRRLVKSDRT